MPDKQDQVELKMNIPELIEFKFNEPKTGQGSYGTWYLYGVVNRGVDKVFFPTEYLNDKLQAFQPLQGKTLEIVKTEGEGKSVVWLVNLPGQVNTPVQAENPVAVPSNASQGHQSCDERFAKMLDWAKKMESRVEACETLLEDVKGKSALELHQATAGHSKTIEQAAKELDGVVEKPFEFPTKTYR